MIYPEGDALKERVRNRYSLVVLASKRAKQIKEGAPPLIDTSSTNSLTIALEEIAAGKVSYAEHQETAEDDESPSLLDTMTEFQAPSEEVDEQPDPLETLVASSIPLEGSLDEVSLEEAAEAEETAPLDSASEDEMEVLGNQPEPVEEA
ncbi:MAG TPA: DNA-directed RNA polymerase subunit omega [Capsulimonadaceae bacterium]|nr:DNA-directed RNA polymerase subunit omega [Capsulimonadaceae bacterium]